MPLFHYAGRLPVVTATAGGPLAADPLADGFPRTFWRHRSRPVSAGLDQGIENAHAGDYPYKGLAGLGSCPLYTPNTLQGAGSDALEG